MSCSSLAVALGALALLTGVYAGEKCYGYGDRCLGEEGHDAVEWHPCCAGYACTMKKNGDWGTFCQGIEPYEPITHHGGEVKKCYTYGERCQGADGQPEVPSLDGCCQGFACNMKKDGEWGTFCQGIEPHEPITHHGGEEKKCYTYGERCMGASGHPSVPYLEGCCQGFACTMSKDGQWGMFCQGIEPFEPITNHNR